MNGKYIYVGCFVFGDELTAPISKMKSKHLLNVIKYPHTTFAYKPNQVDEQLFGEEIRVTVIAYGNDGDNEGVKVALSTNNSALNEMIRKIEVPHITLSVSESGRPVNTKSLAFSPIEPYDVIGIFGGYNRRGEIIIASPEC